jgi:hypothetical protein
MARRATETADWRDVLGDDARFVPEVVVPQMPDIMARTLAAGAPSSLEFMGAGMTGVVFCAGDVAYKVARATKPINQSFFEDEAEWLMAAARVPKVAKHVAKIYRFDSQNLVIERECPKQDRSTYSYGESKLFDLHREIERDMIPHGWSAPEFKPDSYIITTRGPVLVDASMPSRVGQELAHYVEAIVAGERPLRTGDRPSDLAFTVRREIGQTLSKEEANRLEDLIGSRWPDAVEKRVEESAMPKAKKTAKKATKKSAKKASFNNENDVLYEVAQDLGLDPDELSIKKESGLSGFGAGTVYEISQGHQEWMVVKNSDQEHELALEVVKQDLEQEPELFSQSFLESHINMDQLRRDLHDAVVEMRVEDLTEMNAREFWKEWDGNGMDPPEDEEAYSQDPSPTEIEELAEQQAEERLRDPMRYLEDTRGKEDAIEQAIQIAGIDINAAAEDAVGTDGPEHFLARYDGTSHETKSGFVYWRAN